MPTSCQWELTEECNLRCVHCMLSAGERRPDELDTREALAVADDLVRAGCRFVALTGGEPLLRSDWDVIARRLASAGVEVVVATNGLLVDDDAIARMLRAGVVGVAVSLDGLRDVHDALRVPPCGGGPSSFDAAIRAIELVKASLLRISVVTQIHRGNADALSAMYEQLAARSVDAWQVHLALPRGRLWAHRDEHLLSPNRLPTLTGTLALLASDGRVPLRCGDNIGYLGRREPRLRRTRDGEAAFFHGCVAGLSTVCLSANGDVKGCVSLPGEFAAGNVRETPFQRIWERGEGFGYNTAFDRSLLEGGCRRCGLADICRAGCTAMAYCVTGTVYDNPFCVRRATPGEVRG